MLKNYFKIAFRNLIKNKVYSFINISGLAIGMAATILIGLWIADELNFNNHFKKKDRIAQVFQDQTINGDINTGPAIPMPLEFALREQHNDNFEHIIMASWEQPRYLNYGDKTICRITKNTYKTQHQFSKSVCLFVLFATLKLIRNARRGLSFFIQP